FVRAGDGVTVQEYPQRFREAGLPIVLGHGLEIRTEPDDFAHVGSVDRSVLEPLASIESRVITTEPNQPAGEVDQILVSVLPIKPGNLVVLAVGIVIAPL